MTPPQLALQSITYFFQRHKTLPTPKNLGAFYDQPASCFVSLHLKSTKELRGCIGTLEPQQNNLAEEIINNALSAAFDDPRFAPLQEKELKDVDISVDVLSTPELINSPAELDPKKYGVIVSSGKRRGVLLPDIEGVDTVEEQISIAAEKGGIKLPSPLGRSRGDKYQLFRFTVERFENSN